MAARNDMQRRRRFQPFGPRASGLAMLAIVSCWPSAGWSADSTDSIPYGASAVIGSVVYFTADDGAHGRELWRSNGTAAGTRMVMDLVPGPASSDPCALRAIGEVLYFATTDVGSSAHTLWRSDGTAQGTVALHRFPTQHGGCFDVGGYTGPSEFTRFGDRVFFSADDSLGRETWSTDGTPAGTGVFVDLSPEGDGCGDSYPHSFVVFRGALYFKAAAGCRIAVWKTDGSVAGTVRLTWDDVHIPYAGPLWSVDQRLLFLAGDSDSGVELWGIDGSGTAPLRLADTAPGETSGLDFQRSGWVRSPARLGFFARTGPGPGPGEEAPAAVWRSDGSVSGTQSYGPLPPGQLPRAAAFLGDALLFAAPRCCDSAALWKGTAAGVEQILELGSEHFVTDFGGMVASRGRVYLLTGTAGPRGCSLWSSDGTAADTRRVHDSAGCYGGVGDEAEVWLQPFPGGVLFGGIDPVAGYELFRSDGTRQGTALVLDINPGGCIGDCNDDGRVRVDELISAVTIALGAAPAGQCPVVDADGDSLVTVAELVRAVAAALNGCRSARGQ